MIMFFIIIYNLFLYVNVFFLSSLSIVFFFFFSSRRRHTRFDCDWSSDVCSSDLIQVPRRTPVASGFSLAREPHAVAVVHSGGHFHRELAGAAHPALPEARVEIGRASCRERV